MDNPKTVIKVMTVTTIITTILASLSAVTLMASAGWINILATACTVSSAIITMVQLLLVKQAYIGYKFPDEDEEE